MPRPISTMKKGIRGAVTIITRAERPLTGSTKASVANGIHTARDIAGR